MPNPLAVLMDRAIGEAAMGSALGVGRGIAIAGIWLGTGLATDVNQVPLSVCIGMLAVLATMVVCDWV